MDNDILVKILERLSVIETQLKDIITVKDDVKDNSKDIIDLKNKTENQQKELNEMKESNKWIARAVITMALGLVGALVKFLVGI